MCRTCGDPSHRQDCDCCGMTAAYMPEEAGTIQPELGTGEHDDDDVIDVGLGLEEDEL